MKKSDLNNININHSLIDQNKLDDSLLMKQDTDYLELDIITSSKKLNDVDLFSLNSIKFMLNLLSLDQYGQMNELVKNEMTENRNIYNKISATSIAGENNLKVTEKNINEKDLEFFMNNNKHLLISLILEDIKKIPSHQKLAYIHLLNGSLLKEENNIIFEIFSAHFKKYKTLMNHVLNEVENQAPYSLTDSTHLALQYILDNIFYPDLNKNKTNMDEIIFGHKKIIDTIISHQNQISNPKDKEGYLNYLMLTFLEKIEKRFEIKEKFYNKEESYVLENSTFNFLDKLGKEKTISKLALFKNDGLIDLLARTTFSKDEKTHSKIIESIFKLIGRNESVDSNQLKQIINKLNKYNKDCQNLEKTMDIFGIESLLVINLTKNGSLEDINYFLKKTDKVHQDLFKLMLSSNKNLTLEMLVDICNTSLSCSSKFIQSELIKYVHNTLNTLNNHKNFKENCGAEISKSFFKMVDFLSTKDILTPELNQERMSIFEEFVTYFKKEINQGYYQKYSPLTYLIAKSKSVPNLVNYVIKYINLCPETINQKDAHNKTPIEYIKSRNKELKPIEDLLINSGAIKKLSAFEKLIRIFTEFFNKEKSNDYQYIPLKNEESNENKYELYFNLSTNFATKMCKYLNEKEIKSYQYSIELIIQKLEKIMPAMEQKENFISNDTYLFFKSVKDTYLVNFTEDFCKNIIQSQVLNEEEALEAKNNLQKEFKEQLDLIDKKIDEQFSIYSSIVAQETLADISKNTLFLKSKM